MAQSAKNDALHTYKNLIFNKIRTILINVKLHINIKIKSYGLQLPQYEL